MIAPRGLPQAQQKRILGDKRRACVAVILSVLDNNQVAGASSFEVVVGAPAQRLVIFSGIAIPEWRVNDDDRAYDNEIIVRLNYHVAMLDHAVTHVGLASIENDETNFLFAMNLGELKQDGQTGELLLHVDAALMGEDTYLHRFSYQIVAHVRRVSARISGTIAVPREIIDLMPLVATDVAGLLRVMASRVERITPSQGFAYDRLTPVQAGVLGAVRQGPQDCFVDYTIDACPFAVPLQVDVILGGVLASMGLGVGQTGGARPVLLTAQAPDASGVDFGVARLSPVR
jgi:hypothetical protein